jgi:hypothetical protein
VLKLLKNVFFTALMVIGATMATSAVAAIATLLIATRGATTPIDSNLIVYGGMAAVMMAAVFGFFFSFATLFVAGVTMPPSTWLMRRFNLPRPLFVVFGGAAAGLICAAMAMGALESIARSKGGGAPGADMRLVLDICATVGGGLLGYLRHAVLVRPKALPHAPAAETALGQIQSVS